MKYQSIEGVIYHLEEFSAEERQLFDAMYQAAQEAGNWVSFVDGWQYQVTNLVLKLRGSYDPNHRMVDIKRDLMVRIGVRTAEMKQPEIPYPDPILE